MLRTFYKMKKHTPKDFERLRFRLDERFSCDSETVYVHTFPVYRYLDRIVFYGRMLAVAETGDVRIDILDASDGSMYGPWYFEENNSHYELTEKLKAEVEKEMRKVGITYGRKNKNKVSQ